MKIFSIFKITFINIIIIFFLYLTIEIFTGTFFFKKRLNCSYILCNANYKFKNTLYEPYEEIIYTKDEYGFRGRRKDVKEIDILVIGGSTTDERYLNLNDTWTEKLEKKINFNLDKNIEIVNAGIDGQSTVGNIWNFKNWFNRIDKLNPRYTIIYLGINEQNLNKNKYDLQADGKSIRERLILFIKNNYGITYKAYSYLKLLYYKSEYSKLGHVKRSASYNKTNNEKIILNKNEKYLIKKIEKNLIKLKDLIYEFDSTPIFITQRTLRWKKVNEQIYSIEGENFYRNEKIRSDAILNFCRNYNLICIDMFGNFDLNNDDTYDLVHLNPSGAEKLSNEIYNKIKNIIF